MLALYIACIAAVSAGHIMVTAGGIYGSSGRLGILRATAGGIAQRGLRHTNAEETPAATPLKKMPSLSNAAFSLVRTSRAFQNFRSRKNQIEIKIFIHTFLILQENKILKKIYNIVMVLGSWSN